MQVRSFPLFTANCPAHSLPRFGTHDENNPGQTFRMSEDDWTQGQYLEALEKADDFSRDPKAQQKTKQDYYASGYQLQPKNRHQQSGKRGSGSTTKSTKK